VNFAIGTRDQKSKKLKRTDFDFLLDFLEEFNSVSGLAGRRVAVRSGRILEAVVAGRGAQVLLEGDAARGTHRVIRIKAPLTVNSRREVQRPRGRKENKALRARARTSERRLSRPQCF